MNRWAAAALIHVVSVCCLSPTCHITEGSNVTASTISNVSVVEDSIQLRPQELSIKPTQSIVEHSSIHSHHSQQSHNVSQHKNGTIVPHHGISTTPKPHLPEVSQKHVNRSAQIQRETAQFIAAEKEIPQKGLSLSNETAENTIAEQSNISNALPQTDQVLNLIEPQLDSSKNMSNHDLKIEISDEADDGDKLFPWIKSPLLRNTLQYLVTDYFPEKILSSISDRLRNSNETKTNETVSPSLVYPFVMEGVSILLNRLTENGNGSSDNATGETQGVIRGRIANIMTESVGKLLQNKFQTNKIKNPVDEVNTNFTTADDTTKRNEERVNLDTIKSLLPLIQTVQNTGELPDVMSKFLTNPPSELSDLDLNSLLKNYGSQFNGILSNTRVLNAIMKSSNQSDALNLTSIMEQFMPTNGKAVEDGISPKNPLLQSDFVSKVLSKSPVAHLGALDDSIKKLVTSSLERAVSRVKIDQNGQIHMTEGMMKMVNKMLQNSDSNSTGGSAMDSINGILKSVVQMSSGPAKVTENQPKSHRNVTKHSHLHRRFQEKYGKDPRIPNSSTSQAPMSYFVVLVMPLTVWFVLIHVQT